MKPFDSSKSFVSTSLRETTTEGRTPAGALINQQRRAKRRSPLRRTFNLLFVLSVCLNVYFVFFQKTETEPPVEARVVKPAVEVEKASPQPVKLDVGIERTAKLQQLKSRIRPASLPVPLPATGQEATVLEIKIQSSLTHTLCGVLTQAEGCEFLSAYLNRLLVWFFDVNKSMRNGDTLTVIYQKVPGNTAVQGFEIRLRKAPCSRKNSTPATSSKMKADPARFSTNRAAKSPNGSPNPTPR